MTVTTTYAITNPTGKLDFQINTFTAGNQLTPDVVGLANGGFVAAYGTLNASTSGDIRLDFYSADYSVIGSFKTPATGTSRAFLTSSLTQLTNGNVLVVWQESATGNTGYRGRLFSESGDAIGQVLTLGVSGTAYQEPQVAALKGGGFAISYTLVSPSVDVYQMVYSAAGDVLRSPALVNTGRTTNDQYDSQIAALADGGYVVTFTTAISSTDLDLRGAIFNADGSTRKADFTIDNNSFKQQLSAVSALPNGNFVVVYSDNTISNEGGTTGIAMGIFTSQGTLVKSAQVNTASTNSNETDPDVAVLRNGMIVVTWTKPYYDPDATTTDNDIVARIFDQGGNPLSIGGSATEFFVTSSLTNDEKSAVASLLGGKFAAVWQDSATDNSGGSIHSNVTQLTRNSVGNTENDVAVGDLLRDVFQGGAGDDRFIFKPGGGADNWIDFTPGTGSADKIVLAAMPNLHSLADVLALTTDTPNGAVINFGNGDSLTLPGVTRASLTADDFVLEFFAQPKIGLAGALNPANGWTSQDAFPRFVANTQGADSNADIVGFGNSGVYVSFAQGDGTFSAPVVKLEAFNPANGWTSQDLFPRLPAYVNSNQVVDIVGFGNGGVYLAQGKGFGGQFDAPTIALAGQFNPANGWSSQEQFPRQLADVNGDGMADIVAFGNGGVYVSLWGGGSFAAPAITLSGALNPANGWTSQDQFPRLLGDVNGDGKADIVAFGNGGVYVALATGGGSFAAPVITLAGALNPANGWTSQDQFTRQVVDVDGDGMADIVGFGNGGVYVARATGGGNFAAPVVDIAALNPANGWTNDNQFHRVLADANGDGAADIVGFGIPGVLVAQGLVNEYHVI